MKVVARRTVLGIAVLLLLMGGCRCNLPLGGVEQGPEVDLAALVYPDLDGNPVNIGDAAGGNPVYLTFFASWCGICADEIPENNEIYNEYVEKGLLVMYGVNIDDHRKVVERMIDRKNILYPVLLDQQNITKHKFNLMGLPLNVVFDREGKEVFRSAGIPPEKVLSRVLVD